MKPLTQIAQELIQAHRPSASGNQPLWALDATAGNGHDTRFLAELVGPSGRVWAIDIQPAAIQRTREQLGDLQSRVDLIVGDHAALHAWLPPAVYGQLSLVMFNLGYLPGGQKTVVTRTASTLRALAAGLEALGSGGLLSVLAYPGHPGGDEEALAVEHWIGERLDRLELLHQPSEAPAHRPQLWLTRKLNCAVSSLQPA